jgi:hypothetical protein
MLVKIILCVTQTSLPAVKVADRRRRKHFRSVVYELHVSGSQNWSTYRTENFCHFIRNLKFLVYYIIKVVSLIILNTLTVKVYCLQRSLVTVKE